MTVYFEIKPMISVDEFFIENHGKYESLPPHRIQQSPCYQIIGTRKIGQNQTTVYYCKLHPKDFNINLDTVEYHCKY